jgi:hypothetical protein
MNLVVDTPVIITVIVNEPEKAALVAQTQGADLFAPRSLYWEVGNAFSAMLNASPLSRPKRLSRFTSRFR